MTEHLIPVASAVGVHLWQATVIGAALLLLARWMTPRTPSLAHWTLRLAVLKFVVPTGAVAALASPWLARTAPPGWLSTAIASPVIATAWEGPFAMPSPTTTSVLGLASCVVLAAWLVLSIVRLSRLAIDLRSMRRFVALPPSAPDCEVGTTAGSVAATSVARLISSADRTALAVAADRADVARERIVLSDRDVMPSVVGLLRPRVIVPVSLVRTLAPRELAAVLAHEAAHCRRHDPMWMFITRAVEAVFGLHPLVRWISRRLEDTAEMACDDAARDHGIPSRTLAQALAKTVRHGLVPSPAALAVTGPRDGVIARRLDRLRQPRSVGMTRQRVAVALAALCVGFLTVVPLQAENQGAKNTDGVEAAEVVYPKPITMVAPDYPKDARDVEGELFIQVTITATGEMQGAEVVRQDESLAAHESFAANALAALEKWTFEPGTADGKPSEMVISIPFAFRLDTEKK